MFVFLLTKKAILIVVMGWILITELNTSKCHIRYSFQYLTLQRHVMDGTHSIENIENMLWQLSISQWTGHTRDYLVSCGNWLKVDSISIFMKKAISVPLYNLSDLNCWVYIKRSSKFIDDLLIHCTSSREIKCIQTSPFWIKILNQKFVIFHLCLNIHNGVK